MSGIWVKVFPPAAVPGIGDWAEISGMTGDRQVDYTEDDFEVASFPVVWRGVHHGDGGTAGRADCRWRCGC